MNVVDGCLCVYKYIYRYEFDAIFFSFHSFSFFSHFRSFVSTLKWNYRVVYYYLNSSNTRKQRERERESKSGCKLIMNKLAKQFQVHFSAHHYRWWSNLISFKENYLHTGTISNKSNLVRCCFFWMSMENSSTRWKIIWKVIMFKLLT